MKKAIPVIIALLLIGFIVMKYFAKPAMNYISYGHEKADLNDYFDIHGDKDIPIILNNEKIGIAAQYINGKVYISKDLTEDILTTRFYYNEEEELLLYSKTTGTVSTNVDSITYNTEDGETVSLGFATCTVQGEELYIALDYIKKFVNLSYRTYSEPNRMILETEWAPGTSVLMKEATQVRKLAGIKALILCEVEEGDVLELLDEEVEGWTKVITNDGFIGYVENKRIESKIDKAYSPVTEVAPEEDVSLVRDHKINLTWHDIEYPQDGSDLRAALANTKSLNVVSPTWFWLTDNDGNFKSVANANYVKGAHDMGIEVWALVANFHYGTDVDLTEVLSDTGKRTYLAENLVATVLENGADGINVDFESVPKSCADHYVQFIRELGILCHQNNLVLSVDNYVPTEYTAHYNRKEQSVFADYIIIMGYDEHYVGSDAGSVSSIDWMTTGIENTLKYVPKEKLINAIPFYTRVWKTKGGETTSEAVVMEVANDFLARNNLKTTLDAETGQNYAEATFDGTLYQVWMEDAYSVGTRLTVMNSHDIAGVASWKVGQETPDIWDLIANYMVY